MPLSVSISTPPMLEGDALTSEEFLRRWEEMSDLKRAELIDGIVCIPSPVSLSHSNFQDFLAAWLHFYNLATPGCRSNPEATWVMGLDQVPQPDIAQRILPEYGGQSRIGGAYAAGAPELIIEVAVSSYSRDFGAKKRVYEQAGVCEYLIVVPKELRFVSFGLSAEGFRAMEPGEDAVFRSVVFPGLWLDTKALWDLDLQAMNAVLQQGLATPEHLEFATHLVSKKR